MKVHPIPHAIFETSRSGFIQVLHHCSVSWKITPLYFFNSNLIYFGQKKPIEVKFSELWVVGSRLTKLLMSYLKPEVTFSLNFASDFLFQKWQEFSEFWSEHSGVSKICTLIGHFCTKYIAFDLKKCRKVIFHDTEMSCKICKETHLWFVKWHEEFGKFSPEHLEASKLELWWDPFTQNRKFMS